MSSFGRYCEVARNEREPIGRRYKSIRYAAEHYCGLTHTSFESVFAELARRHGFKVGSLNSSGALSAAAVDLESARHAFLRQMTSFVAQRRVEKRSGRRYPSKESLAALARAVSLGQPYAGLSTPLRVQHETPVRRTRPPEFEIGDVVQVVLNERNRTLRTGPIIRRIWHFKQHRWLYFIRHGSRNVSKRYFAEDFTIR